MCVLMIPMFHFSSHGCNPINTLSTRLVPDPFPLHTRRGAAAQHRSTTVRVPPTPHILTVHRSNGERLGVTHNALLLNIFVQCVIWPSQLPVLVVLVLVRIKLHVNLYYDVQIMPEERMPANIWPARKTRRPWNC